MIAGRGGGGKGFRCARCVAYYAVHRADGIGAVVSGDIIGEARSVPLLRSEVGRD